MKDYERRAANERTHNRLVAEATAAENGEEVVRFSPKVPAFELAMSIYSPYLARHMPNMNLDEYVLGRQNRSERNLRLLSLGCGTGDWELGLARASGGRLSISLADLTAEMMERAQAAGGRDGLRVETQVCDVNRIRIPPASFDFVVCRSSLHHFLKLEHVLEEINRGLAPDGRFLAVGEWVGRNGLQYYPETERLLQSIFSSLPARLRLNRLTGQTDDRIPHVDFSANSFEAIRSQDILPLLFERLEPIECALFDGLVTPLFEFRYGPNYDLENELDRTVVETITRLDIELIDGRMLKPTSLFGIFGPRRKSRLRRIWS